jgi:ParB-like chromosome segregation protein Spo0J
MKKLILLSILCANLSQPVLAVENKKDKAIQTREELIRENLSEIKKALALYEQALYNSLTPEEIEEIDAYFDSQKNNTAFMSTQ